MALSEWKKNVCSDDGYDHHHCLVCGEEAIFNYITEPLYDENYDGDMEYICDIDVDINEYLTPYCPYCGSKMYLDKPSYMR